MWILPQHIPENADFCDVAPKAAVLRWQYQQRLLCVVYLAENKSHHSWCMTSHQNLIMGVIQRDWMKVWAFTSQHTVPSSPKPPQRLQEMCFHLYHHCQTLGKHLPVLLQTDTYILPPHFLILSAFNYQQAQELSGVH